MNSRVKQEVASTIMTLVTIFFRIHDKAVSKENLNNMAHKLYLTVGTYKLEPSMNHELEVLSLINIQFCALKFLTLLDKSNKLYFAKPAM
jgi:hypothetical protein